MTDETRKLAEELRTAHDAMLVATPELKSDADDAEQAAWNAYALACLENNECFDLECEKKVPPGVSYCPDHKE